MIAFLFFLFVTACFVAAFVFGTRNKLKGPKGELVKDEMKANWIKEIDGPEEPLTDREFKRLLRSYQVSLTNYPMFSIIFYMVGLIAVFIGWYAEFNIVFVVLELIVMMVCAIIHVTTYFRNKNIIEREWEHFTKKQAIVVDTKQISYFNPLRIMWLTGRVTNEIHSMRLALCNRNGEPRIYTIPILGDIYSKALKIERFDVVMYKGKFSTMLASITEEEAEEEAKEDAKARAMAEALKEETKDQTLQDSRKDIAWMWQEDEEV